MENLKDLLIQKGMKKGMSQEMAIDKLNECLEHEGDNRIFALNYWGFIGKNIKNTEVYKNLK